MGRRKRVVWSLAARRDLDRTLRYLAERSPQAAARFLIEVRARAGSLSTLADRGRLLVIGESSSIREVFVGRYRLVYRVTGREVILLALIHGARAV